ncbi:AraC family ligand binding domain-containing protein [Rufibacter sp. LB8]|uniref:AraC family ligand binding domain-containing protein n=1 Tax=Rufibacter sp. LB8 TaxID=2777781 RepID=UPI00178C28A7|nr:AraC family ligand binding domain-containing protein [Rufibacter sp. LB8]
MIRAYKLYTDAHGDSRFTVGTVADRTLTAATAIQFKETPPGTFYDWHVAPTLQFVLTLCGTLEFTTSTGETFTLRTGDVLLATDTTCKGHKWQMLGSEPWRRAYVLFHSEADMNFIPDEQEA